MKLKIKNRNAFTLIELLIYVSIFTVIISSVSAFAMSILKARIKNQATNEVIWQGERVLSEITQNIRNANSINSPLAGEISNTLSLAVSEASKNPTIYKFQNNTLTIQEGTGNEIELLSNSVNVANVTFDNLANDNTDGSIKIQFTLSFNNPTAKPEYNFSQNFYGAASIR